MFVVPEKLRTINRPEEIKACVIQGHRKGDLINGASNCSVVGDAIKR